jgi:uncharacterized protein
LDKSTHPLIKAYLEKADSKIKSAIELLEKEYFDDAVSRAYYAAFHAAQAILVTEGLHAETHRGLMTLFGLHFVKTGKFETKFGKMLSNLKDDRETGDYEAVSFVDQEIANNALAEAKAFVQQAKKFLKDFL